MEVDAAAGNATHISGNMEIRFLGNSEDSILQCAEAAPDSPLGQIVPDFHFELDIEAIAGVNWEAVTDCVSVADDALSGVGGKEKTGVEDDASIAAPERNNSCVPLYYYACNTGDSLPDLNNYNACSPCLPDSFNSNACPLIRTQRCKFLVKILSLGSLLIFMKMRLTPWFRV